MPFINVPIVPWNDPEFVAFRKQAEKDKKAFLKEKKKEEKRKAKNGK